MQQKLRITARESHSWNTSPQVACSLAFDTDYPLPLPHQPLGRFLVKPAMATCMRARARGDSTIAM